MIYDHLNNISSYKNLSPDLYAGLEYLQHASAEIATGVHQINPRVKAIVSEYETKQENKHGYEAHKKNIDIQYLLRCEERVACLPIERLKETKPYSEEKDAIIIQPTSALSHLSPSALVHFRHQPSAISPLSPSSIFPQDGHMPQLSIDYPMMVKKVVVKVEM